MIVTLQSERVQTLADVRAVIDGNDRLDYQFTDREAAYEFIRRTLVRFDYPTLSKPDKGVIGRYLAKMTGLSRAQMTRLVGQHRATGRVTDRRGGAPVRPFERRYTGADIRLLAEVDAALGDMSGPATRAVMRREFEVFGQRRFERLARLSNGRLYNLRRSHTYQRKRTTFTKTRPTPVAIGEAASPGSKGSPASYASPPFTRATSMASRIPRRSSNPASPSNNSMLSPMPKATSTPPAQSMPPATNCSEPSGTSRHTPPRNAPPRTQQGFPNNPLEAPVAHPPIAGRAPRAIASTLASTVHPLTCLPIPPRCTLSFYIQPRGPQPDSPRLNALRSGSSSYWKTLTLNDIKGKKFAFVSPTSGGVGPRFYLNKNGINPEKDVADIIYAGKHDSVYLAIKNNKVDAGAVGDVYFPRWKERGLLEYTSWDDPNDTLASPDIGIIGC